MRTLHQKIKVALLILLGREHRTVHARIHGVIAADELPQFVGWVARASDGFMRSVLTEAKARQTLKTGRVSSSSPAIKAARVSKVILHSRYAPEYIRAQRINSGAYRGT